MHLRDVAVIAHILTFVPQMVEQWIPAFAVPVTGRHSANLVTGSRRSPDLQLLKCTSRTRVSTPDIDTKHTARPHTTDYDHP
jgi:hypothetical protein